MADQIAPAPAGSASAEVKTEEVSILDRVVEVTSSTAPAQRAFWRDIMAEFANLALKGTVVYDKDVESMVKAGIAELDTMISAQLNAVMHAPEFQKLEATWRGLHYLINQTETSTTLKIRVLNVPKKELSKDLARASEFDQSALYKKVFEAEYGMFGGSPFGLLVGDYEFEKHNEDVELLERLSNVAAAAHAPLIAAAGASIFGWNSYEEMNDPRDLAKIFDSQKDDFYVKWRSFRESEDSKYVGLCLPHVLMRQPYGRQTVPVESFNYEEDVDGKDHRKYLWGNAAYALATRITDAFAKFGWCTAIRGVEGGGLVQGLPTHSFRTDQGDIAMKCPTEVQIPERRDNELSNLGFIPLVHSKGRDFAAFFAVQSTYKPRKFDTDYATANSRLTSQLPYMFAMTRFAHYMKTMMRERIGAFMTRKNCEDFLNRWISQYVLLDDNATQEQKAKFPLREARIEVEDVPGRPGAYRAISFLKPHFQLDQIDISLRLVADLPPPRK